MSSNSQISRAAQLRLIDQHRTKDSDHLLFSFLWRYLLTIAPLAIMLGICFATKNAWAFGFTALVAGLTQNVFGIFMHESSHYFLCRNEKVNDLVADFLVCLPIINTAVGYRIPHISHHKYLGTERDPYLSLYKYDHKKNSLVLGLLADFSGVSSFLKFTHRYTGSKIEQPRYYLIGLIAIQVSLFCLFWLATGYWWSYFMMWILPLATIPAVINRIRTVVEHFDDHNKQGISRNVRPNIIEYLLIAPFGYSYHSLHHLHLSIPYSPIMAQKRGMTANA